MVFRPVVKEAAPGHQLRWLGRLLWPGLFDGEHSFLIQRMGPGEVRFRQSEVFRGVLVPVFPEKLYERTKRGFESMNRALKEKVEGQNGGGVSP